MRISDWSSDVCSSDLIRVNVLSPGPTATELAKAAVGEEGLKVFASMNPLRRMAEPTEVAAGAAFLASNASSFLTASEPAVDGGLAQNSRAGLRQAGSEARPGSDRKHRWAEKQAGGRQGPQKRKDS